MAIEQLFPVILSAIFLPARGRDVYFHTKACLPAGGMRFLRDEI